MEREDDGGLVDSLLAPVVVDAPLLEAGQLLGLLVLLHLLHHPLEGRIEMSDIGYQMSDVRCQMSDVRCQMSDFRCQMSARCRM